MMKGSENMKKNPLSRNLSLYPVVPKEIIYFEMLHNTMMLEANVSSETPVALYQSTRRKISEQLYLPDPIFI
jgi:hypothetical protein